MGFEFASLGDEVRCSSFDNGGEKFALLIDCAALSTDLATPSIDFTAPSIDFPAPLIDFADLSPILTSVGQFLPFRPSLELE